MVFDPMVGLGIETQAIPVVFQADGSAYSLASLTDGHCSAVKVVGQIFGRNVLHDIALRILYDVAFLQRPWAAVKDCYVILF